MALNVYEVIRRPRATSKAQSLNQKHKQIVLEVHPQATKQMIISALKVIFNADVERIGTLCGIAKAKRQAKGRRAVTQGKRYKRAVITLKHGSSAADLQFSMNAASAGNPQYAHIEHANRG